MIYDKFAKKYDDVFAPFESRFLSKLAQRNCFAYLPVNSHILEIGAGTGANFQFYPPLKKPSPVKFRLKCSKWRKKKPIYETCSNRRRNFAVSANSFDAAFATLVFCSIAKTENAFRELMRVVKPNGKIILLEHVRPKIYSVIYLIF